jgi:dephospho-CoA kinase
MGATPPIRIGLTGGIGSGKSTVARLLAQEGAAVIDTDAIARQLTLPGGAAIEAIRSAFGDDLIDATGAMDRTRMRDLAFSEPGAKQRLEAILHPMIGAETERQAAAALAAWAALIVFDVPLLVESLAASKRWRERADRILVVDCSEATQVARVMARSGWSEPAVRAVIAQQATREQRRAAADDLILNDGVSVEELAQQVHTLARSWLRPTA